MKCELCQKADAETAITRLVDGKDEELYVCHACAQAEKRAKQKRSQRTRKQAENDGGEEPPPIIGAILNAVNGIVTDFEKITAEAENDEAKRQARKRKKETRTHTYPLGKVPPPYRVRDSLMLAGLDLIGELAAVKRAVRALDMELVGIDADGVRDSGRVFKLKYTGSPEQAGRIVNEIIIQEGNARRRIIHEMPRVFADSLGRALAVVKNCRLLASGELFDLLCALRLGAINRLFEGLTLARVDRLIAGCDLSSNADDLEPAERDRQDAERADETNALFEDVILNERAEEMFK